MGIWLGYQNGLIDPLELWARNCNGLLAVKILGEQAQQGVGLKAVKRCMKTDDCPSSRGHIFSRPMHLPDACFDWRMSCSVRDIETEV